MEFNWGSKKKLKGSKMKLTMISGIHKKKKEMKKYIYIYIFSKDQSAWDGWMDGRGEPQTVLLTGLSQCYPTVEHNSTAWDPIFFPFLLALGPFYFYHFNSIRRDWRQVGK